MSADFHWQLLLRYAREEIAAGGPDPQIEIVANAIRARAADEYSAAMMAGEFVNCYTVAAAAVQWLGRERRGCIPCDPDLAWWQDAWGPSTTLPMRKERRAVKSPEKLHRCDASWRRWVRLRWPVMRRRSYPAVYDSVSTDVWGLGRYATIKVLETMHRVGLLDCAASDVRADGNTYGRRALAALYPDRADQLSGNSLRTIRLTDALAFEVRERLRSADIPVSWYDVEVFLCTYRQALTGKYPGRSQDRELAYWLTAEKHHGPALESVLPFRAIRAALFDDSYLGEVYGWTGPRVWLEDEWKKLADGSRI